MAIRQFTQEIGIKPAGQGISEFSTSLPTPDLSGVRRFASSLADTGEEYLKIAAKQTAEDAANGTQIVKNDAGQYERIAAPESFGPYAKQVFEQAVDQNYINTVYRDVESELNTIASDRQMPPDARIAKMDAHITGVLKNVDPKFVGVLAPILGRERNQRQGSILNLAQSQSISALENSLTLSVKSSMDTLINAVAVGNEADAKLAEDNILNSTRSRIQLSTQDQTVIDAEVKRVQDAIKGVRYLSPILDRVRTGIANGTLLPEELGVFTQMMTAGVAPAGSTAFGVTDQDLVSNVNEFALSQMRPMFEQAHKNYLEQFKQTQSQQQATELNNLLVNSNISFLPADKSDTDLFNAAKLLVGPDIYNPQAIRDIGYSFNGLMPKEAYGNFFKDAYKINPSTPEGLGLLQKQIYAYEALQSITTKSGSIKDMTDMVNNTDRNFFRIVLSQTKDGNKSVENAVLIAQSAIKDGLAMDESKRKSMVFGKYREAKKTEPTEGLILSSVSDNFSNKIDSSTLPERARSKIIEDMSLSISQGIDYDTAAKDAAKEFERNWVQSTAVISTEGGIGQSWVPKSQDLPTVQDPVSRETSSDYINGYIPDLIDMIDPESVSIYELSYLAKDAQGKEYWALKKDQFRFKDTVRLEPTGLKGQNTYFLSYYNSKDNIFFRLRDKDNKPIIIDPTNARNKYDAFLQERNLQDTVKKRAGEKPSISGGYFELTQPTQEDIDLIAKDPIKEFKYKLDDIKPSETFDAWLGRNSAKMAPQTKSYVDFTVSKLNEYGMAGMQKFAIKTLGFESGGFNPDAKNPLSSARGIGQMTDETWAQYGKGLDRNNPEHQIDAAIRYMKDIRGSFLRNFDRAPSDSELYILYQQGPKGGTALLKYPNMKAIDVLTSVYNGNRQKAVSAVQNNLKGSIKFTAGRITARDFTKIIGAYVGD